MDPLPATRPTISLAASEAALHPGASRLHLRGDLGWVQRFTLAAADVVEGVRLLPLGWTLGWLDISLRYRGSALGPLWLTISTAIMVAALGYIYGTLFHMDLASYLPFLSVSLVLWNAGIGAVVSDACATFLQSEQTIRSLRLPHFVQVVRVLVRNLLVMAHSIVVPFAVFAIYHAWPGFAALWALPGLALWTLDAAAVCMLLGGICARFRDVPQIVASVMQVAFYITPVVWKPEQLGARGWWLPLNPFHDLLDVVRAPLLGHAPGTLVWQAALAYSAALCAVAWIMFARTRPRLAFWV
ncbi:lipopolysaccharide transport system permease protein [Endobacter medicaginis]|jgi:lipopolysaccharide transport system permease protein|uniref:ABC transporter permease n=1 Tax=Endobacter medicaginis TaxID=1181271 RepID=A0A839UQ38_9PROT|nr:ABC transporter permease [Endobacter medicaginis]MBB3172308.1 lipopolysaccharide transport system permease protein [Endobacter medicaginis]MCX5474573.1 ABC transporter permease [Endobacter medicaginis]NVN30343.1 ABC transporter permease [Endobacter medicaginis]